VFRAEDEGRPCEACERPKLEHPGSSAGTQVEPAVLHYVEPAYDAETTALIREPWRVLPTIATTLATMPPPGERLATGIPTLDRHSRGGFARGRVYTFVGPPGKGKTALVAQLCRTFAANDGALVVGFFVDEGSWQVCMMVCEGLGFDRETLEDSYATIQEAVAEKTRSLQIYLPRPDGPDTVLEAVDEWLAGAPEDTPIVIAADSVQRVRPHKGEPPATRKEHAEAVMTTARRLADRHNATVLLCAKANRASWSHKNPADNLNALASALDSSAIEYDSDALFFMGGDPSQRSFLHIEKNRPGDGQRVRIALGFDRDRATFAEIDEEAAEAEAEEQEQQRAEAAWSADEKKVLKTARKHPGRSARALRPLAGLGSNRVAAILDELQRKGRIEYVKKGWFVTESATGEES
jgi:KaiC/GvpD/RAD55 family RecA-like ATPase